MARSDTSPHANDLLDSFHGYIFDGVKPRNPFGKLLRELRASRGIRSAAALGRLSRLSASHIAMFERGEVIPRWPTATKLADALGLDATERERLFRTLDVARKPESVA